MSQVGSQPASTRRDRTGGEAADRLGGQVSRYRKRRRLTIAQLARAVGVTPSLIGQIERGQSQPSVTTLYSLAKALGVPVSALAARHDLPAGGPTLVRPGERTVLESSDGIQSERLASVLAAHVQFLEVTYSPGAESSAELERHPGVEMILVVRGRIDALIEFDCYALEEGDSVQFASTLPHRYVNASDETARAVTVILSHVRD
jgi:transcriptional regulator with XRE-family HTH domain